MAPLSMHLSIADVNSPLVRPGGYMKRNYDSQQWPGPNFRHALTCFGDCLNSSSFVEERSPISSVDAIVITDEDKKELAGEKRMKRKWWERPD